MPTRWRVNSTFKLNQISCDVATQSVVGVVKFSSYCSSTLHFGYEIPVESRFVLHDQYADAVPINLRLSCNQLIVKENDTAYNIANLYLQHLQESLYVYSLFNDLKEFKYNYCLCAA